MLNDVRYAARTLRKNPGFTIVALVTLALGIGGTSAMFALVHRLLLNPLPFPDSDRLVVIWGSKPQENVPELPFSQPDFEDLRAQQRSFETIGAWALGRGNLTGGAEPEQVQWAVATASLFDVLGVRPQIGRAFTMAEDRPGTAPAAIISHRLWQRRFGAAPTAIGRTLQLDRRAVQIVGVLPADFSFVTHPAPTDIWLALGADPFEGRRFARGARSMGVLGRLRTGSSLAHARAEGDTIAAQLAAAYPRFNTGRTFVMVPLREQVTRGVRTGALVLLAAVACVLLIACANVSSLLLARATAQHREFAIRAALGASWWRLLRQQLVESLLLGGAGGAAGLLLSVWLVELLLELPYRTGNLFVPYSVPSSAIRVDWTVVAFTFALATAAAVVFGGVPALLSARASGADALRAGVRATAARRQQRTRAALVISEVAIALTLLVTAALMIRSFARLQNVDPGFAPSGLLSLHVTLSRADYTAPPRIAGFFERALETLAALPGAEGAAAVEYLPFSGVDGSSGFYIEGRPAPARADEQQTHFRSASAGYFSLMRIPLAAGRAFTSADDENGGRVAIINEAMARRFWPAENPIGRRIALDLEAMRFFPDRPPVLDIAAGMREIVGIVRDVRHASLRSTADPEMYIPYLQRPVTAMTLLVRSTGDPSELAAAARQAIHTVDANQPVAHIETVSNLVSASVAQPRANYLLLSAFAVVAVALAVIGVYGLLAFNVVQRTPELGIRLALGGSPADIRRLIVTQGVRLVGAGIACGIPVALATASAARTLLFGVEPADLVSFASSVVTLSAAAMMACYLPARRATAVDPITALRTE